MSQEVVLICGKMPFYPDDLVSSCAECHCIVYCRYHSPAGIKRYCIPCAVVRIEKEGGDPEFLMSKRCAQEVREYLGSAKN